MSEKRFTIHKENMYKEDWYDYPFCIKEDGEVVLETIPLFIAEKVRDKLNEQQTTLSRLEEENEQLKKENNDYEKQFRIINEKLDEYIKTADTYRIPIPSLEYGDDLGYFNGVYQYMKKLKKDIGGIGYE